MEDRPRRILKNHSVPSLPLEFRTAIQLIVCNSDEPMQILGSLRRQVIAFRKSQVRTGASIQLGETSQLDRVLVQFRFLFGAKGF